MDTVPVRDLEARVTELEQQLAVWAEFFRLLGVPAPVPARPSLKVVV